jgi:hypothetical protein
LFSRYYFGVLLQKVKKTRRHLRQESEDSAELQGTNFSAASYGDKGAEGHVSEMQSAVQ